MGDAQLGGAPFIGCAILSAHDDQARSALAQDSERLDEGVEAFSPEFGPDEQGGHVLVVEAEPGPPAAPSLVGVRGRGVHAGMGDEKAVVGDGVVSLDFEFDHLGIGHPDAAGGEACVASLQEPVSPDASGR